MLKKKNYPILANRYKNKLCDACYLGFGIIWDINHKIDNYFPEFISHKNFLFREKIDSIASNPDAVNTIRKIIHKLEQENSN